MRCSISYICVPSGKVPIQVVVDKSLHKNSVRIDDRICKTGLNDKLIDNLAFFHRLGSPWPI